MVLGQEEQHYAVHRPSCEGCSYLQALHALSHHRERPTQALLRVGNGAQGMVGHKALVALSAKQVKKKKNRGGNSDLAE